MKRAYLLRHGMTEANKKRLYCGWTDIPLSEEGRSALLRLRASMHYPDITGLRVYTSGMLRTEETLSLLFGQVPHTPVPGLREMNFGAFEMHGYEELKNDPAYLEWISGENEKKCCPGGESGEDMTERVLTGFTRLLAQDGDFLVLAHGGPIAAIMTRLFPESGKNRYEWQPAGGTGYEIDFLDGRPQRWQHVPIPGKTPDER